MSENIESYNQIQGSISRRDMLRMAAWAGFTGAAGLSLSSCAGLNKGTEKAVTSRRINQSIVYWCFAEYWDLEKICQVARQLGCKSIELIDPEHWPTLKKYGLTCAIANSGMPDPPFVKGFNNPRYHDECIANLKKAIDSCADFNFPSVITFTGFREDIPDDVGANNCVTGLKKVIGYAEKKRVNVCLEILNSRVDVEMKGHPGYQGDHTDYCIEIIKKVGSPRMKLLFDIYHVQIMDGDVISRIRQYKDYIGHYHTAGVPGRCEIDDKQELNYRPIMEEIANSGYKGYVGQEFIPTRDPLKSLTEAVVLCDV